MTKFKSISPDSGMGLISAPLIEMHSITKSFGTLRACDDVSFALKPGKIHGILGQNGAGKSTLMKILLGLIEPDNGHIEIDGREVFISSPHKAADLGIAMVHQHFSLVDSLSVWENVILGEGGIRLDGKRARSLVGEIADHYSFEVDPESKVRDLSVGQRQRVEIIKCLRRNPRVLVFDEPTSVLTPDESENLFTFLRQIVQQEGRTVALVSHKLEEVLRATDEVTIMRDGHVVAEANTRDVSAADLARLMVGRDVTLSKPAQTQILKAPLATPVLSLSEVSAVEKKLGVELNQFSLDIYTSEIVGIVGAEGNGQRVLVEILSSLRKFDSGNIAVDGTKVESLSPGAMANAGIAVLSEDRNDSGCILEMSVAENLALSKISEFTDRGVLDLEAIHAHAVTLIDEFGITCESPNAPLWTLSGGNQQRVLLARELSSTPKVLVIAHPTRGLDVAAIEFVNSRLRAAADRGISIVLISSDLDEILNLVDRIVVIYRGSVVGEMSNNDVDLSRLGMLIGGAID